VTRQVVTDALLYHRELAARRRRPTEGGGSRRLDRRNALYVLAVNLPLLAMLRIVGGAVIGSIIKAAYFAVTKQLDMALAQAEAVGWLFLHPVQVWQARRRRAAGRAEAYAAVRTFIPPARTLSRLAEKVAGLISDGPPQASGGRHQAAEESEEDAQFVDTQSVVRKIIGNPGVQLFTALLLVALIAERRLLGTSPLGGGALEFGVDAAVVAGDDVPARLRPPRDTRSVAGEQRGGRRPGRRPDYLLLFFGQVTGEAPDA